MCTAEAKTLDDTRKQRPSEVTVEALPCECYSQYLVIKGQTFLDMVNYILMSLLLFLKISRIDAKFIHVMKKCTIVAFRLN